MRKQKVTVAQPEEHVKVMSEAVSVLLLVKTKATQSCYRRSIICVLLVLGVGIISGCTPFIETYSRISGRGSTLGVYDTLSSLDDELLKKVRRELLNDKFLQQSAAEVARGVVQGMSEGSFEMKLEAHVDKFISHVSRTLEHEGGPAFARLLDASDARLQATIKDGVKNAVLSASKSFHDNAGDLSEGTFLIARAAVEGGIAGLAPGLNAVIGKDDLFWREELPPIAGLVARTVMREAVLGFKEGLGSDLHSLVGGFERKIDRIQVALIAGIIAVSILFIGALVSAIYLLWQYRLSLKALAVVSSKIKEVGSEDLKLAIQESATRNQVQPWLTTFLKSRGL